MALRKMESPTMSYDEETFYVYQHGELVSVYMSIYSENYGKDMKIIGIGKGSKGVSRYMTPSSFEKRLKLWFDHAPSNGIEIYTTYDEPTLWLTKEPQIMKGRKTTARKTVRR